MDSESDFVKSPDNTGHTTESNLPRPSDPIPIPASTVSTQQSFIEPNSPPGKHARLRIAPQTSVDEMARNETRSEIPETAPVVSGDTQTGGLSALGPGISTGNVSPLDASDAVLTSDYETTEQAASDRATQSQSELMSMDSIARSLHDDVNVDDGYIADVPSSDLTTEDDAPSSAVSRGSDSEVAQGGGISDGDEGDDSSVTIGERESISDFLSDGEGDALELDLEDGGYEDDNDDGDGDDDSTGDVERFI